MAGKRIAVFSLFVLVVSALTVFASSGTEAGSYKAYNAYSLAALGAGANSDSFNEIGIYRDDYNYEDSSMFTFVPIDGWTATGETIPLGTEMGALDAVSTVGLANGACAAPLEPEFVMYNASTDSSDVLGPDDTYWILKDADDYPVPTSYGDPNLPDYLELYPHFLNEALDPDGDGPKPPLQPRARYVGYSDVVSNMNIIVQIVVFHPGQLSQLGGIYAQLHSGLGSPSLVVLNNPISQEEAPGAISDFCTPLSTVTHLYADVEVEPAVYEVYQTNPLAGTGVLNTGTHIARNYSRGERDADGDGLENDLDPCHYTDDSGWDPTAADPDGPPCNPGDIPGDDDCDGLPNSCDPNPTTANPDEDNDGYNNRQDICPLVQNGCNVEPPAPPAPSCHPTIWEYVWDNQADDDAALPFDANDDLGPSPDSIGNACDDSDNDGTEDGVGASPGSGNCTDGIDNDFDGKTDVLDPDCTGYEDAGNPVAGSCWDGIDNDSTDGTDWADSTCIATAIFFDNGELQYGTDPWGSNPSTGLYFHSIAWDAVCVGATDTDGDGYCDDLEDLMNGRLPANKLKNNGSEADLTVAGVCDPDPGGTYASCCNNALDDDLDGYFNDGCPTKGTHAETGAQCAIGNAVSDDTPTPDTEEPGMPGGPFVNDGCPVIGVPEGLVIDVQITSGAGTNPSPAVPVSCSDSVDNDGDTFFDAADNDDLGCDPSDDSYVGDDDYDGLADASDNCDDDWNPEQTDTDGDDIGDVCDTDDDDDAFPDDKEWWMGTDPRADCPRTDPLSVAAALRHDAWPLDMNMDRNINLGGDVIDYVGKMGGIVATDPSLRRLDLNGDGNINLGGDVIEYVGKMGSSCTYP